MNTKTFDSVWDALEDDPIKRENLKLRSQLLAAITAKVQKDKLTPSHLTTLLNTTQPRISALLNEKIELFRIDMLINYAIRLGMNVSVKTS